MDSLQSNSKVEEEAEQNSTFEEEAENISKGEKEAEVSISLPEDPTGTALPSGLDDSVPHESLAAVEEPNDADSEKLDVAEDSDQPGPELKIESDSFSENTEPTASSSDNPKSSKSKSAVAQNGSAMGEDEGDEEEDEPPYKKQKQLDSLISVPHESSTAVEEPNNADLEKSDAAKDADRPGSDLKIESDSFSEDGPTASSSDNPKSPKLESAAAQNGSAMEEDEGDEEEDEPLPKKQKQLNSLTLVALKEEVELELVQPSKKMAVEETVTTPIVSTTKKSKSKKKNNNVWVTKSTRKGKKKSKINTPISAAVEDKVLITPVPRFPDKGDDTPESEICLSKVYKAEKVEISEDRLTAGSSKGYRMVRATRGVVEGAWYFEIKVLNLGETGHTRLGWSTDKGDLQAPVGYDGNSFGFRDIDGCKIHKALREVYAEEGYKEGDVIGFYINLPDGESFAPKPPHYVWYKGQRYVCAPDVKEEPPKVVPGSEILFFKNGVCQGVAFKDLFGGRYYPAASMYTLPDQSNCVVKFNFGPDFEFYPENFGERATPRPMWEVPYHGFSGKLENNGSDDMKS